MSDAIDDPTERAQTLQVPRGGIDALAVVALVAGVAAVVGVVVGFAPWLTLVLAASGLFVAMVSLLRSRPSGARWLGTIAIIVSAVPLLVSFFIAAL